MKQTGFDIDMTEKNSELFEAIKRYKIAQKNFDNCNNDFFADANAELTAAKMHLQMLSLNTNGGINGKII